MYIENSSLSPQHAEVKFDGSKYLLKDCNSESGTWVRIGTPCDSKEFSQSSGFTGVSFGDIDLYKEPRLRMYRAGNHQFRVKETEDNLNEVTTWLRANSFEKLIDLFAMKKMS